MCRRLTGRPAQVDDPADAGLACGRSEVPGAGPVDLFEVAPAERVDEVVDDVDVGQRRAKCLGLGHVAGDHLDPIRPRHVAQPVCTAGQAPHRVSRVEQPGHQAAADVSARPGHQTPHDSSLPHWGGGCPFNAIVQGWRHSAALGPAGITFPDLGKVR